MMEAPRNNNPPKNSTARVVRRRGIQSIPMLDTGHCNYFALSDEASTVSPQGFRAQTTILQFDGQLSSVRRLTNLFHREFSRGFRHSKRGSQSVVPFSRECADGEETQRMNERRTTFQGLLLFASVRGSRLGTTRRNFTRAHASRAAVWRGPRLRGLSDLRPS